MVNTGGGRTPPRTNYFCICLDDIGQEDFAVLYFIMLTAMNSGVRVLDEGSPGLLPRLNAPHAQ